MSHLHLHQIIGPEPSPDFFSGEALESNWGAKWGAADEVSTLRTVLMRRPNSGLANVSSQYWDPERNVAIDPDGNWYWFDEKEPDLELLHAQYDGYVATLRQNGVEVVFAEDLDSTFTKSMYTRDPLVTVPGGAVILRLAPRMRRGEEQSVTRAVAAAGLPILATMTGTGIAEGGSFVKLRKDLAAFGTSVRSNEEGFVQLRRFLEQVGIELIRVPLPGYGIHLDGALAMVDHDLAVVNPARLPYEFLTQLNALGIETVPVIQGEEWLINSLVLAPRKLIVASHLTRSIEMLTNRYRVEVVPVDYSEIAKNGGGLHCSTMELRRDW